MTLASGLHVMQNNRQNDQQSTLAMVLTLLLTGSIFSFPLLAQTDVKQAVEIPPVAAPPPNQPEENTEATEPQHVTDQEPPVSANESRVIQEYKSSEQIGADSAVAFPIDI